MARFERGVFSACLDRIDVPIDSAQGFQGWPRQRLRRLNDMLCSSNHLAEQAISAESMSSPSITDKGDHPRISGVVE